MLLIQLDIIYKEERHYRALIELNEYTLLHIQNEIMKITSEDDLTTLQNVQLFVTNLENK